MKNSLFHVFVVPPFFSVQFCWASTTCQTLTSLQAKWDELWRATNKEVKMALSESFGKAPLHIILKNGELVVGKLEKAPLLACQHQSDHLRYQDRFSSILLHFVDLVVYNNLNFYIFFMCAFIEVGQAHHQRQVLQPPNLQNQAGHPTVHQSPWGLLVKHSSDSY